jgi:aryl-alcohol dehydrogenase-like predicted oxidoreductase
VEYIRLGRTGPKVSVVGFGAWQAGGKEWGDDFTDSSIIAAIGRSLELGVNFIDTAEIYGDGHSEEVVGQALKKYGRENFVVATKFNGEHLHYGDLLKACDASLARLGVKEIDVYQMHWTDPWEQVPLRETMKGLRKLKEDGKVVSVAVSNFAVRDLEEARGLLDGVDIVSDQVRYNLLQMEIEAEVLPYCKKEGISVIAWSPLAKGVLTGKYSAGRVPKDPVRVEAKLFSPGNLKAAEGLMGTLKEVALRRGKTIAQVSLNWLLMKGGVVVIPGAKNPSQAEENAGASGWRLTRVEIRKIAEAADKTRVSYF